MRQSPATVPACWPGTPAAGLVRKCLGLARKGGWGEQAASREITALLAEDDGEASAGLLESAEGYYRAHQNIEATLTGLAAAYLAWKVDSPAFMKAVKLLSPLVPLHPGFKKDPLLGKFMARVELFLEDETIAENNTGIRAYLVGKFRVYVDGREIPLASWGRTSAIKALAYLLLSPRHRIPTDHLFYLLWPRRRYSEKTRKWLYRAVSLVRSHLWKGWPLNQKAGFLSA